MKRILTMIVIGLLCLSMISMLSPSVHAFEEFLNNGGFEDGLTGWNYSYGGRGSHSHTVIADGTRPNVMYYQRWDSGADGGSIHVGQNLDILVSDYEELYIELDAKVIANGLPNSGWWSYVYGGNGEFPARVLVNYEDESGRQWQWDHHFFPSDNNEGYGRTNFEYVPRNTWCHYISPNLLDVTTTTTGPQNQPIPSPTPYRITSVWVGGTGWDFSGMFDNVSLLGVPVGPDVEPPITTINLQGGLGESGWYVSDVTVSFSAQDSRSGVNKTRYSLGGATWSDYEEPFVITTEGIHSIYFYSIDNAGNVEQTQLRTVMIDKAAPTINIASPEETCYTQAETLTLDFEAADTVSGVASTSAGIWQDPAVIYMDPQTSFAEVGGMFSIDLRVAEVTDLYGWQIKLAWDPAVLEFVSAAEGGFLSSLGPVIFPSPDINQVEGYVRVGCALLIPPPGASGSGLLATVTLRCIAYGETALDISAPWDTYLLDSNLGEIPREVVNGYFQNLLPEEHDIAITDVTVSTTKFVAGETITVDVTIENQGTRAETFDLSVFYGSNILAEQNQISLGYPENSIITLVLTWNTAGIPMGSYAIMAAVSLVPGEVDTLDNNLTNGIVAVGMPVYDGQTLDLSTFEPGKYTLSVKALDNAGNEAEKSVCFSVCLAAVVDIDPNSLNLKSQGTWITGYIELPEGYDVHEVNVSSIRLNGTVPVDPAAPVTIGDYDVDGVPDLTVKFDRNAVISYIYGQGIRHGNVVLTVMGMLNDGTAFKGSDVIKVIFPDLNNDKKVDICDLAIVTKAMGTTPLCPQWNPLADMNEDARIDIKDLALVASNYGATVP